MSWKVIECELTDHLLSFMWPSKSIEMAVGVKEIPRVSPARARPALGQYGLQRRGGWQKCQWFGRGLHNLSFSRANTPQIKPSTACLNVSSAGTQCAGFGWVFRW